MKNPRGTAAVTGKHPNVSHCVHTWEGWECIALKPEDLPYDALALPTDYLAVAAMSAAIQCGLLCCNLPPSEEGFFIGDGNPLGRREPRRPEHPDLPWVKSDTFDRRTMVRQQLTIQEDFALNIKMAGIDHRRAGVEPRELFSFTKSGAQKAMKLVREKFHAAGCILLSTCNRTELWLDGGEGSPLEIPCDLKGLEPEQYADVIWVRQNSEAVEHLLKTACGTNSQLFGDDQIITQIGQARASALAERGFVRELDGGCSSPVAAFSVVFGDAIALTGLYPNPQTGQTLVDTISGKTGDAEMLGVVLARNMTGKTGGLGQEDSTLAGIAK